MMLSRRARDVAVARQIASTGSICLPSRCSSIWRGQLLTLGRRNVGTQVGRPWSRHNLEMGTRLRQERTLATAVDDYRFDNVSYAHFNGSTMPPFQASSMSPYDFPGLGGAHHQHIMLPDPVDKTTFTKNSKDGIPGDIDDLLPIFDACIRVGKLDRAALVLQRLNKFGALVHEDLIVLHNQYLRASIQQIRLSPDYREADRLHEWYKLHIQRPGLPLTAETIACMLKASLLCQRGPRLEEMVRRYMSRAPDEAGLKVLSMADILSDQDLAIITDICPTYNFTPESDISDDPISFSDFTESAAELSTIGDRTPNLPSCPDIVPTPQKGEGLLTVKKSLKMLASMQETDLSALSTAEKQDIQLQLERDSVSSAIERWRVENKKLRKRGINTALGVNKSEGSLSQHMGTWMETMEVRVKELFQEIEEAELKETKNDRERRLCSFGPILLQADPARLAAITILCTLNLSPVESVEKGIHTNRLVTNLARAVQDDIDMQRKETQKKLAKRRKVQFRASQKEEASPAPTTPAGKAEATADKRRTLNPISTDPRLSSDNIEFPGRRDYVEMWSTTMRVQIGSALIGALLNTAKVRVERQHPVTGERVVQDQAAFAHSQQPRRGKKIGVILPHADLMEKMRKEPVGDILAKHLPMIAEPKPWRHLHDGGFLDSKTSFIRVRPGDVEQSLYTKAAINAGDMKQVFKGLDVLGKTAWKVNRETLDVMVEVWNTGESLANMPPLNPQFNLPPEPDSYADPTLRREWMRKIKNIEDERSGLHSQRCHMNMQLEIARAFRNQTMYFPHNVDYRGRAYPIPTYLNHMGADHTRGLLRFAEGKRLGDNGLRWLKIHLANLYGLDKASFEDREAFATEHKNDIIDSATSPLKGQRWWLRAEDPWQCLSACFELKAAWDLPDPTEFVSCLPVHQDGTCNGLQHYAALGGDTWGAKQVNLEPGDRPADVYSAVAELVKESITKDAAVGNQLALPLVGKITRKVVKQTVMTNVYGVTFTGAKQQVCKQIDALYPTLGAECGIPNIILSTYIAKQIFNALATMFRGAHDIQYWLGEVGGRVCRALTPAQIDQMDTPPGTRKIWRSKISVRKSGPKKGPWDELKSNFRSTVVWTTPLRMPVVQPYRKSGTKEVKTALQTISIATSSQTDPVHRRKQLQGFPPNFIHSLDASHMLLSALQCHEEGLTFAAVHDSFWTHAADVDVMNGVIRESFIRIHEEDVIGRLANEFETRHKGSMYLAHIDPHTPVGQKIKELRKNSKLSPKDELILEHKRNTLRLSGNPWDLEAAKQLVTPASVYEEMSAQETDVEIERELAGTQLGIFTGTTTSADNDSTLDEVKDSDAIAEIAEEALGGEVEIEAEAVHPVRYQDTAGFHNIMIKNNFEITPEVRELATVKKKPVTTALPVWLPLTVPPIPKKGDFDVRRLRESKYFFS